MLYHEPDGRWEGWGCPNYESYLEKYLVKGNFDGKIPKDIVGAFTTVEFLTAHSYYRYEMYDDALNRTLRIMEMAVKLRCTQLSIDLKHEVKKKNGEIKSEDKDFNRLNQDLIKTEKNKELCYALDWVRFLRNGQMHPTMNSFMGGMTQRAIIKCVEIINLIFAEGEDVAKWNTLVKTSY
jgi:hypothetical protein